MSVKREPSGRRSVSVEVEVPGTPEDAWRAVATGPGITAWFVPTEMEEREGGEIVCDFGPGMQSCATVTAWEPPRRFAAEGELGEEAPTMASEWSVEPRDGGTCVVRVTHSLVSESDEWDEQLAAAEAGWPGFFEKLELHLRGSSGAG